MSKSGLSSIPPVPVSSRMSFIYAEYGYLEMDGYAVVLRQAERLLHLPVGGSCAVLIMPGTVVTHAAVKACAEEGTLLIWVGENGVRCYAAGNPGGANADALLKQAGLRLDPQQRLNIARRLYRIMFGDEPPAGRSIDQMRGIEGARVKDIYRSLCLEAGVEWHGRSGLQDPVNQAISGANAALYGLVEAVILALGYSPAIGFVHSGDPRSFVFDVADCLKFRTVVPLAISVAKTSSQNIEGRIRHACRDLFHREALAAKVVDTIEQLLVSE